MATCWQRAFLWVMYGYVYDGTGPNTEEDLLEITDMHLYSPERIFVASTRSRNGMNNVLGYNIKARSKEAAFLVFCRHCEDVGEDAVSFYLRRAKFRDYFSSHTRTIVWFNDETEWRRRWRDDDTTYLNADDILRPGRAIKGVRVKEE